MRVGPAGQLVEEREGGGVVEQDHGDADCGGQRVVRVVRVVRAGSVSLAGIWERRYDEDERYGWM